MDIQWYPGHMTKARRMLAENLKLIDVVVELIDARAPIATRNPDFDELFAAKCRLIIFNKSDLADKAQTRRFINRYREMGIEAADITATNRSGRSDIIAAVLESAREKTERMRKKGVIKTVRAMIVGIPNVGKSTLINTLAGGSSAATGDRPGVTRGKQWVKVNDYLEFMDTPGLLWPKLEDQRLARHLAFIGSINDEITDREALATELLDELNQKCPQRLTQRYKLIEQATQREQLLEAVAKSRGFVMSGGEPDLSRAARIVLDEFRGGKTAKVTLETVDEL